MVGMGRKKSNKKRFLSENWWAGFLFSLVCMSFLLLEIGWKSISIEEDDCFVSIQVAGEGGVGLKDVVCISWVVPGNLTSSNVSEWERFGLMGVTDSEGRVRFKVKDYHFSKGVGKNHWVVVMFSDLPVEYAIPRYRALPIRKGKGLRIYVRAYRKSWLIVPKGWGLKNEKEKENLTVRFVHFDRIMGEDLKGGLNGEICAERMIKKYGEYVFYEDFSYETHPFVITGRNPSCFKDDFKASEFRDEKGMYWEKYGPFVPGDWAVILHVCFFDFDSFEVEDIRKKISFSKWTQDSKEEGEKNDKWSILRFKIKEGETTKISKIHFKQSVCLAGFLPERCEGGVFDKEYVGFFKLKIYLLGLITPGELGGWRGFYPLHFTSLSTSTAVSDYPFFYLVPGIYLFRATRVVPSTEKRVEKEIFHDEIVFRVDEKMQEFLWRLKFPPITKMADVSLKVYEETEGGIAPVRGERVCGVHVTMDSVNSTKSFLFRREGYKEKPSDEIWRFKGVYPGYYIIRVWKLHKMLEKKIHVGPYGVTAVKVILPRGIDVHVVFPGLNSVQLDTLIVKLVDEECNDPKNRILFTRGVHISKVEDGVVIKGLGPGKWWIEVINKKQKIKSHKIVEIPKSEKKGPIYCIFSGIERLFSGKCFEGGGLEKEENHHVGSKGR